RVAIGKGDREQIAVVAKGPAVIRALEASGVALRLCTDHGCAMGTAVEECVDLSVRGTCNDRRPKPDRDCLEVIRIRDLALMQQKHPRCPKHLAHLLLEDSRIRENAPMDHSI